MFTATVAVSLLLAALLSASVAMKLSHKPAVVENYAKAGVPEERLNLLAAVLGAGVAGLIAGLFWAPIGIAAGIGLVLYFLLAVAAHVRADDAKNAVMPVIIMLVSALTLYLRIATA